MKFIRVLTIIFLMSLLFTINVMAADSETQQDIDVLFIGNSYTYYYNVPDIFEGLAEADGKSVNVTTVAVSSYTMKKYASQSDTYGSKVYEYLTTQDWDYVILQENSVYMTVNCETRSYPYIRTISDMAKKAGAEVILYMVPSYSIDYMWTDSDDLVYEYSPDQRLYLLGKNTYTIGNEIGAVVAPVGYMFDACSNIYPDIDLYYSDSKHPSYQGSYLAACTIFASVFDKSPLGISYIPKDCVLSGKTYSITEEETEKLQKVADQRIALSDTNIILNKSCSKYLTAEFMYTESNDVAENKEIKWTTLDDDIAIVDSITGRVTALKVGTARIMAYTSSGVKAICNIEVKQPAKEIDIDGEDSIKLNIGAEIKYTATVYPLDSTDSDITWSSSDKSIASVDSEGNITAKSAGRAFITVSAANGVHTTIEVKVRLERPAITSIKKSTKGLKTGRTNITVKWEKVSKASGYAIYRRTKTTGYKLIATVTSTKYTDTNRYCGKTYYYKVRALGKYSSFNSYLSAGKTMFVPKQVNLKSERIDKTTINLTWKKVTGADGYAIYRSTKSSKGYKRIATVKSGSTITYTNYKLSNRTYYYKVRAYKVVNDKKVYGNYSKVVKVSKYTQQ